MIPREETEALAEIVDDAFATAASYSRSLGYLKLLKGEERWHRARSAGEPWADDLAARYREAVRRFHEEFGCPE